MVTKTIFRIFNYKFQIKVMKELFLLRGLPGAGKTTLGDSLGGSHFEADLFHINEEGVYDWKPENVRAAHKWCQDNVEHVMTWSSGREVADLPAGVARVVVSNTFTQEWEMQPYFDLAQKYGYRVYSLIVENRHGGVNQHSVPQESLDKMRKRFEVKL